MLGRRKNDLSSLKSSPSIDLSEPNLVISKFKDSIFSLVPSDLSALGFFRATSCPCNGTWTGYEDGWSPAVD